MMTQNEKLRNHQSDYSHPQAGMNMRTTFNGQSIQQLWRHFNKKTKCQPHAGTSGKLRRSPKSLGFMVWEPWISEPNFMVFHP